MGDGDRGVEGRVADLEARLAGLTAALVPLLVGRRVTYAAERRVRDYSCATHTPGSLTGSVARVLEDGRVEITGDDGTIDVVSVYVIRPVG